MNARPLIPPGMSRKSPRVVDRSECIAPAVSSVFSCQSPDFDHTSDEPAYELSGTRLKPPDQSVKRPALRKGQNGRTLLSPCRCRHARW